MCGNYITSFAKHFLIVINVLFFFLGVAILVLGTWISVDKSSLIDLIGNSTNNAQTIKPRHPVEDPGQEVNYYFTLASLIIIGIGSFIVLLSLVGCFGAIKESKCLLISYSTVVILITIVQSIGIILSAVYQKELKTHMSTYFKSTLKYYGHRDIVDTYWNGKMNKLDCCGVHGYEDFNKTLTKLPTKCCIQDVTFCTKGIANKEKKTGCLDKVYEVINDHLHYLIIIAAVVIITEILGIAFALGLNNNIDSADDDDLSEVEEMNIRDPYTRGAGGNRIDSTWM